jgi:hypothetical protein
MFAVNKKKIGCVFNEDIQILWPDVLKFDNMLFLATDTAPCMKKGAEGLSVSLPKLIIMLLLLQHFSPYLTIQSHPTYRAWRRFKSYMVMRCI